MYDTLWRKLSTVSQSFLFKTLVVLTKLAFIFSSFLLLLFGIFSQLLWKIDSFFIYKDVARALKEKK
jgi:hypothetical protein